MLEWIPEQWMTFIQEKWWLILLALVAAIIVLNVVKTVLKWVLIVVIVIALGFYGVNYTEELTAMGDQVIAEAKEQAFKVILDRAVNAEYKSNEDGTFAVVTESLRLEGKEGSNEVKLFWKDIPVGTFQIDAAIQAFLEQAKSNK